MIILEEDLDVSKDIMDYFSQLIPVLASDDSVYCVSAWNDQVNDDIRFVYTYSSTIINDRKNFKAKLSSFC